VKPIDNLTGADFFPDIIGMEQHIAFGHLFRLLHASSRFAALRRGGGLPILLYPFLLAQNPGYEYVGQALRFCLSLLIKIKAVPARTCTVRKLGVWSDTPRFLGWNRTTVWNRQG
jgi:hypothetical protein